MSNVKLICSSQDGAEAVENSAQARLHLYMVPKAVTEEEAGRLEREARWKISAPDTSGPFSAVAWYAGRTLLEHLPDVHVGIIACCWGGTFAHCWMPEEDLTAFPEGQRRIAEYNARIGKKTDEQFAQELTEYQQSADAWNARDSPCRQASVDTQAYNNTSIILFVILDSAKKRLCGQYLDRAGKKVLGENCKRFENFPMLIKLIDAKKALSLQVHPSDEYALTHEGQYGKTEMWVVLDAEPGAFLYYGFEREVTREEFARRIADNTLTDVLHKLPVQKGSVVFIPAGTLHAIGAGIVIAEIQQNSNVTYRVSDYGRLGPDGRPRPLHVEKALEVTNLRPTEKQDFGGHLGSCPYFTVDGHPGGFTAECGGDSFHALLVTGGSGTLRCGDGERAIREGGCFFLPAGSGEYRVEGGCTVLDAYLSE